MVFRPSRSHAIIIIAAVLVIAGVFFTFYQPPSPLLWGAYVGKSDGDLTHNGDLAAFETLAGRSVDIQATFVGWNGDFPSPVADQLKPQNKKILIYWLQNGVTLDDIIAGKDDSYIERFAGQVKNYGGPVLLAPFHEMNGEWNPWAGTVGTNTPTKVIAAWQHVHAAFASVPNVSFVWIVNNGSVPDVPSNALEVYYPGSEYVDYVGVDGFNFGTPWFTWDETFPASLIARLAVYKKPIFISSTGSVPGSDQAQWIKDMGAGIRKYPEIVGWVWFDQSDTRDDFRVDSNAAALAAFKSIIP